MPAQKRASQACVQEHTTSVIETDIDFAVFYAVRRNTVVFISQIYMIVAVLISKGALSLKKKKSSAAINDSDGSSQ